MFNIEKQAEALKKHKDYVSVQDMIALEEELTSLKEAHGMADKRGRFAAFIDKKLAERRPKTISRSTYIKLLVSCGWFSGAHRFYAGKKITGVLYILLCLTGISFAMSIIDLMQVLPIPADGDGNITL